MKIEKFETLLNLALNEAGINQAELALRMDISPRHISRVKKSGGDVPQKFFDNMCAALGISPEKFLSPHNSTPQQANGDEYFPVPFREAGGGMGGGFDASSRKIISHISMKKDFLMHKTNNMNNLSFIHAVGESMSPNILPEASILIDEGQTKPVNNKIYYILWNGQYYIKRLEVKDGAITAIISDNGNRRDELNSDDQIEVLGRAIMQVGDL